MTTESNDIYVLHLDEQTAKYSPEGADEARLVERIARLQCKNYCVDPTRVLSAYSVQHALEKKAARSRSAATLANDEKKIHGAINFLGSSSDDDYEKAVSILPKETEQMWRAILKDVAAGSPLWPYDAELVKRHGLSIAGRKVALRKYLVDRTMAQLALRKAALAGQPTSPKARVLDWVAQIEKRMRLTTLQPWDSDRPERDLASVGVALELLDTIKVDPYGAAVAALPTWVQKEWLDLCSATKKPDNIKNFHGTNAIGLRAYLESCVARWLPAAPSYQSPAGGSSAEDRLDPDERECLNRYKTCLQGKMEAAIRDLESIQKLRRARER